MSRYCKCGKSAEEQKADLQLDDVCIACDKPFAPCAACGGLGFRLASSCSIQDELILEIEPCDVCEEYKDKNDATAAAFALAKEAFDEHWPRVHVL